jgi:hypothetical protein
MAVTVPSVHFKNGRKPACFEGMVGGERIANTRAHSAEAAAVGERPLLVREFAEQGAGGVKALRANPFQPPAAFDRVEKPTAALWLWRTSNRVTVSSTTYSVVRNGRRSRANFRVFGMMWR